MKALAIVLLCAAPVMARAYGTTNTVLMVDQNGALNVEGVASVASVASNTAMTVAANQKAEVARQTASAVSNEIDAVAQNLMENNEVIYRSGFSDSFAPLVVFTDSDVLAITDVRWVSRSSSQLVADIDYVCTVDIGAMKPTVMHRATIGGGATRADFAELADANVSEPSYTSESRVCGGQTFSGFYTVSVTVPNPASTTSYFLWIKADADAPSGDGATLDLPNGVTGGATETVTWGDRVLTFRGGVLTEVE